jgi:hypothetical protein
MLRRTVGKHIKLLRHPNCRSRVSESIGSQRNLDEKMPYAGSPVTGVMLKKGRIDARAVVRASTSDWVTLFLRRNTGQLVKSSQIGKCSVAKMLIASCTPQIRVTLWYSFQSALTDLL